MNFFLLVLRISLDFGPDAGQKNGRFSEILPEKSFKSVASRRDGTLIFNLVLKLLLMEVDLILEEQNYKKDALGAHSISRIKIILTLSTKIVALHAGATIIQVGVSDLQSHISR